MYKSISPKPQSLLLLADMGTDPGVQASFHLTFQLLQFYKPFRELQVIGSHHYTISEIKFRRSSLRRNPTPTQICYLKNKGFQIPPPTTTTTKFQKILSRPKVKHLELPSGKTKIQPNENTLLCIITF